MQRRKPLKRTRRTRTRAEREAATRFKAEVCSRGRCYFCDEERTFEQLDAAHLIKAELLRAHTSTLPDEERWPIVYDPRLGVPACTIRPAGLDLNHCHGRLDAYTLNPDLGSLPARAIDAATEHGLMHLLERRFGEFRV